VRIRQISRWAKGHNSVMMRYGIDLIFSQNTSTLEKLDGALLLGVYAYAPILIIGWAATWILFFLGETPYLLSGILSIAYYGTFGNFATFFQLAAAVRLDAVNQRIRLLPFTFVGFLVSVFAVSRATLSQISLTGRKKPFHWSKTERFRKAA
jgi:hypothetical protein